MTKQKYKISMLDRAGMETHFSEGWPTILQKNVFIVALWALNLLPNG